MNDFTPPADGFYHLAALGNHPHKATGLTQVIDTASLDAIIQAFRIAQQNPRYPGILVDYDHASLDKDKPSEAAGWITELEQRPEGLFGQIRWADKGAEAVIGGRYRYISPVWLQSDCEDMGNKCVRPKKVLNCALTNDPNIPGLCPLTNRGGQMSEEERKAMFAKMGGGGGGGGGAPRGGGPAAPAADPAAPAGGQAPAGGPAPAPSGDPSSTPTPQPTSRPAPELSSPKLQALKDQREAYANFNPDPPAPVKDPRRKIDPDQAFKDALRQGKGLNEARAAEKNAQQEKDSAKAELKSLRSALKKDGVNFAGMDEAIDKELAKRDRRYSDAMEQYGKTTSARDKVLDRLNLAIAGEEQRIASSYERDQGKEQRAFEQAMKEKVRQDLAAERERRLSQESQAKTQAAQQKLAAKQAADAAKANDPVRQFAAKTRKAGAFIRALEAGDTETAKRMFPGADINTYASAAAGINGKSTRRAQLVRDFIREIN